MRKRLMSVAMVLLCSLRIFTPAQVVGKWERITKYSNKTGERIAAVVVRSLSTVPEYGIEYVSTLIIVGGSQTSVSIDFG